MRTVRIIEERAQPVQSPASSLTHDASETKMPPCPPIQPSCISVRPNRRAEPLRIQSRDLLRGGNLLLIDHEGDRYYLRMTRNNKLILTK